MEKGGVMMRKMGRFIPFVMVGGGIFLSQAVAGADQVNKPHTFSAGTPAQADQVNANFDMVYGQVNRLGAAITVGEENNVGIGIAVPAARLDVVSQPVDYYSPWSGYNPAASPCTHCLDTCNGDVGGEFTCPEGQSMQCEDVRNSADNGPEYRLVQCNTIQPAAGFRGDVKITGGKLTAEALALPVGAANGSVLTSDGGGNATWRALPVSPYAEVAATVVENGITSINIAAGAITPEKLANTCAAGEALVKTATGWACGTVVSRLCSNGDFISCYHGSFKTLNVGACKAGIRPCLESGTGFGECAGEVLPAADVCDGIDNDCDGTVDNGPGATGWYQDNDGDGFGNSAGPVQYACTKPAGYVSNNQDCNDTLSSVFHAANMSAITVVGGVEICGDGVDNDCDGQIDNAGCSPAACTAGEIAAHNMCMAQCGDFSNPSCFMACLNGQVSGPCDNAILQAASCLVQNNCFVGPTLDAQCARSCRPQWEAAFGGLPAICTSGETRLCGSNVGECRQGTEACVAGEWSGVCAGGVAPVAEICGDGLDNDCNGGIDDTRDWYADADGDGYGNPAVLTIACAQPAGFVGNPDDCDDANNQVNPGAAEICDGIDNNCDGRVDEGCFLDSDGDGVPDPLDCAPFDPTIYPGAVERCGDGIDNNCNGQIDENCGGPLCGDSRCDVANGENSLNCPSDCPAEQICNDGIDNDGNGLTDCADPACSSAGVCADSDGDGYPDAVDCAPFDAAIHPGAIEVCGDGIDNNCDGQVDEGCGI